MKLLRINRNSLYLATIGVIIKFFVNLLPPPQTLMNVLKCTMEVVITVVSTLLGVTTVLVTMVTD